MAPAPLFSSLVSVITALAAPRVRRILSLHHASEPKPSLPAQLPALLAKAVLCSCIDPLSWPPAGWCRSSCRRGSRPLCWAAACARSGWTPMRSTRYRWPTPVSGLDPLTVTMRGQRARWRGVGSSARCDAAGGGLSSTAAGRAWRAPQQVARVAAEPDHAGAGQLAQQPGRGRPSQLG